MLSNLLSPATESSPIPTARQIDNIKEVADAINSKGLGMKAIKMEGFTPRILGVFPDVVAEIKGGTLRIFEKFSPDDALTYGASTIRAYDENAVSITIYFKEGGMVILQFVAGRNLQ